MGAVDHAGAHADLETSEPGDGAEVEPPVEVVTLRFTGAVEPVVEDVRLLDGDGTALEVGSVTTDASATEVRVTPTGPLEAGTYGLRWAIRAGDSHPKTGTVTFTVSGPPTAVPDPSPDADREPTTAPDEDLRSALAPPDTAGAERLGWTARALMYGGVLATLGGLAFAALVHQGRRGEVRRLGYWIRRASLVVIAATVLEALAQVALLDGGRLWSMVDPGAVADALGGSFGIGIVLRVVGAAAVLGGLQLATRSPSALPASSPSSASAAADHGGPPGGLALRQRPARAATGDLRLRVGGSPVALMGAAMILASFVFIGHTVTEGPRVLTGLLDVVHVAAAACWLGGVVFLAAILRRRQRRREPLDATSLVAPFSVVATYALVVVSVAGFVLSLVILDDLGALASTTFGRLLLVKVALVAGVAGLGGHTHLRLLPRLEDDPGDEASARLVVRNVGLEVVGFALVVAVTAALVASSAT